MGIHLWDYCPDKKVVSLFQRWFCTLLNVAVGVTWTASVLISSAVQCMCIGIYIILSSLETIPTLCMNFPLRLTGVLGSGEFGTVNQGVWESPMGAMDVAVKQLQLGASEEEKVKFLQEAAINGQFRHPNVVKLMGVVTTGEPVSKFAIGFSYHALEIIMFMSFQCKTGLVATV